MQKHFTFSLFPSLWRQKVNMTILNALLQDVSTVHVLCAVLVLVLLIHMSFMGKTSAFKLPPGPTPFPIIGNLHMLDLNRPDKSLMKLSEEYGNVFTIQFGPRKAVVLVGYEVIQDALINHAEEFGERATIPIFEKMTNGNGLVFSHGENWKAMRRFALSTLRDFGMGKRNIEDRIHQEAQELVTHFESHKGQPFHTKTILNHCVTNVISSIVLGKRFDYEDPVFLSLIRLVNENVKLLGSPAIQLYNFYPYLGFLFGVHKTILRNVNEQRVFFRQFFKSNKQTLNENDIRSFVDAFMLKQQEEAKKTDSHFHEENLLFSTMNLFGAGLETTSTTLQWALLLMMKYPEIQKNVQEEIDRVIADGRLPKLEYRKNMPYTDAVIHEIQRFANLTPLPVSRATTCDTHFRGYFIPKETTVVPLLTSVLYDKTQWETPDKFTPSHFLDANGKFVKRQAFMPFSAGRRICLGESLAKAELFLFFTALLQKFSFCPSPGVTSAELDLSPVVGLTLTPKPQLVCAVPRK